MDPFAVRRPAPTKTTQHSSFENGYRIVPTNRDPGPIPGPRGYNDDYRAPHFIADRDAHNDFHHQDPYNHGKVFPAHLVYRRKNGDKYVIPPKPSKTVPELRIMPQTTLYANKCLRHYGYHVERLFGGDSEYQEYGYRVRQVVLIFHMEDDTIQVHEPRQENSGLDQGVICPRGPYYFPVKNRLTDRRRYRHSDFKLGRDYQIAHYLIHLNDADGYTKNFWKEHLPLDCIGEPEPTRIDPVWQMQQAKRLVFNTSGEKIQHNRAETIDPHPKVYHMEISDDMKLQFVGIVDDTNTVAARCRPVVVEYFFIDETMKVAEFRIDNDAHPFGSCVNTVVQRGRIPRTPEIQGLQFGLGPIHKPVISEYYTPKDLFVGNTLWLYGRKILLVECNEWTRKWQTSHGIDMEPNREWKKQYERRPYRQERQIVIPPHTGFGTHEDSLRSVFELRPQVTVTNELPWLCNSEDIIKYSAKMFSRHPDASLPVYSIWYFLADDKISVHENRVVGDASYGRKFLSKQVCPLGDHLDEFIQRKPCPPPHYDYRHFLPGNILNLWGHRFLLTVPEEGIFRIMQKHPLYSEEEAALIKKAIDDSKALPPPPLPPLTDDELMCQRDIRAIKMLQWIKFWIFRNPTFLMLLLSEGDDGPVCSITEDLLEYVCRNGRVDWDKYSGSTVLRMVRDYYSLRDDQPLFVEQFLKYVFRHGGCVREVEEIVNPVPPSNRLKFRLDLHC